MLRLCYLKKYLLAMYDGPLMCLSTWEAEVGECQGWRASLGYIYSKTVSKRHKYYLNEASSIFSSEYALLSV